MATNILKLIVRKIFELPKIRTNIKFIWKFRRDLPLYVQSNAVCPSVERTKSARFRVYVAV